MKEYLNKVVIVWTNVNFNFFTFVLYHITFKVELNSNMLYKKGAKFIMDNCCLEKRPKYFKTAFKDFKVFTGLWSHHLTTSTGGWVACLKLEIKLSQPQLKLKLS